MNVTVLKSIPNSHPIPRQGAALKIRYSISNVSKGRQWIIKRFHIRFKYTIVKKNLRNEKN